MANTMTNKIAKPISAALVENSQNNIAALSARKTTIKVSLIETEFPRALAQGHDYHSTFLILVAPCHGLYIQPIHRVSTLVDRILTHLHISRHSTTKREAG